MQNDKQSFVATSFSLPLDSGNKTFGAATGSTSIAG
jgi:hypothetical protein